MQKNTQIVMCFLLLFIFFGFRDLPILNVKERNGLVRTYGGIHFESSDYLIGFRI